MHFDSIVAIFIINFFITVSKPRSIWVQQYIVKLPILIKQNNPGSNLCPMGEYPHTPSTTPLDSGVPKLT